MDKNELLRHALLQFQYLKGYDANNPRESYDKVRNSFNSLFKKTIEYWNDNYEENTDKGDRTYSLTFFSNDGVKIGQANNATLKIDTDPLVNKPIKKEGNAHVVRPWRELRNENIKKLYQEAKSKNVPIDDDLIIRISQIVGTTRNKTREVISLLQFNEQ